jgi:hypothetical protein
MWTSIPNSQQLISSTLQFFPIKMALKKQDTVTKPRSTHPTEHPQPLAVFAMVRSPLLTLSGWGFQHPMAEILMV